MEKISIFKKNIVKRSVFNVFKGKTIAYIIHLSALLNYNLNAIHLLDNDINTCLVHKITIYHLNFSSSMGGQCDQQAVSGGTLCLVDFKNDTASE